MTNFLPIFAVVALLLLTEAWRDLYKWHAQTQYETLTYEQTAWCTSCTCPHLYPASVHPAWWTEVCPAGVWPPHCYAHHQISQTETQTHSQTSVSSEWLCTVWNVTAWVKILNCPITYAKPKVHQSQLICKMHKLV